MRLIYREKQIELVCDGITKCIRNVANLNFRISMTKTSVCFGGRRMKHKCILKAQQFVSLVNRTDIIVFGSKSTKNPWFILNRLVELFGPIARSQLFDDSLHRGKAGSPGYDLANYSMGQYVPSLKDRRHHRQHSDDRFPSKPIF